MRTPPSKRTHGLSHTGTFKTWQSMLQRCTNPRSASYPDYGGRGIRVCDAWATFERFVADMGMRPPGMTLERADNEGGYSRANCRWATPSEQSQNRRCVRLSVDSVRSIRSRSAQGETGSDLAREFGVSAATVSMLLSGRTWKNVA